jgi:O-antigen ligase
VRQARQHVPTRLSNGIFYTYLALLMWAPLPFASERQWGAMLLVALVSGLSISWLILFSARAVQPHAVVLRQLRWPLTLLLMPQLWLLLQLAPLPASWVAVISPRAAAWHVTSPLLTLSLDPQYTQYFLLRGLALVQLFALTCVLVDSQSRLRMFLVTLVVSGVGQALYGSFMVLSGLELGFFILKYVGHGSATGTFINSNHFAGYLVMCIAAGSGLLLSQMRDASGRSWRDRARDLLNLLLSPRFLLRVCLIVMVVALILSRSRSGNLSFFIALTVAAAIAIYCGRRFARVTWYFFLSLLLIDLLIFGQWFGLAGLLERVQQTDVAGEMRFANAGNLVEYVQAFWLTGSGGGSFYSVFPMFQQGGGDAFHQHAHNDYLQFVGELGLMGSLPLLFFVLLTLKTAVAAQRERRNALSRGAGFGVVMVLVWCALHSLTDFNLQIMANAATFVCLCGLAWVARYLPSTSQ